MLYFLILFRSPRVRPFSLFQRVKQNIRSGDSFIRQFHSSPSHSAVTRRCEKCCYFLLNFTACVSIPALMGLWCENNCRFFLNFTVHVSIRSLRARVSYKRVLPSLIPPLWFPFILFVSRWRGNYDVSFLFVFIYGTVCVFCCLPCLGRNEMQKTWMSSLLFEWGSESRWEH